MGQSSESPTFNWHDYIALSPLFSREEASTLSKLLDDISQAHDGDGRELIIKAGLRNCRKLNFVPGGKNNYDDTKPEIQISFRDAGRTVYTENGVDRLASMNGILVHELFHAGDPNPTSSEIMHYASDHLDKLLTQYGYSADKKNEVNTELASFFNKKPQDISQTD